MRSAPSAPIVGQGLSANWAKRVVEEIRACRIIPGKNITVRYGRNGTVINGTPGGETAESSSASEPYPFACRYVEKTTDASASTKIPYTGWEIYLPNGCVSIGANATPFNPQATRTVDGETAALDGWYRLPVNSCTQGTGDSAGKKTSEVVVHAKCAAVWSGVDSIDEWPKRYAWAEARKTDRTYTEKQEDANDVGDTFETVVGRIVEESKSEDGETKTTRKFSQGVTTPLVALQQNSDQFQLLYKFKVDASAVSIELEAMYLRNKSFSAAGVTFAADNLTEVPIAHEAVYLKVCAATYPYTAEIKTYAAEAQGDGETMTIDGRAAADKGDLDVMVQLYSLKNGHVVTDSRENSLRNIQVFQ